MSILFRRMYGSEIFDRKCRPTIPIVNTTKQIMQIMLQKVNELKAHYNGNSLVLCKIYEYRKQWAFEPT